jgi:hypothetical protein
LTANAFGAFGSLGLPQRNLWQGPEDALRQRVLSHHVREAMRGEAMGFFTRKKPEPLPPEEKAKAAVRSCLQKAKWCIESEDDDGFTAKVAMTGSIPMKSRLKLSQTHLYCDIDAGLRLSPLRAVKVLLNSTLALHAVLRVSSDHSGALMLLCSTMFAPEKQSESDISESLTAIASEFTNFLSLQVEQMTLYYPFDFTGFEANSKSKENLQTGIPV